MGLTSRREAPRNANTYKPGRGKTVARKFRACDGRDEWRAKGYSRRAAFPQRARR
jgi:hypothetical protein